MKLIAISHPGNLENETEIITKLFEEGLEYFHLRKPNYKKKKLQAFLNAIPKEFHNRIILHKYHLLALDYGVKGIHITNRHLKKPVITGIKLWYLRFRKPSLTISSSFHDITTLKKRHKEFTYVFLSPIFNSISKKGYKSAFNEVTLQKTLKETDNVMALGGVTTTKINKVRELGFSGACLLGALWHSKNPVESFRKIKERCAKLQLAC